MEAKNLRIGNLIKSKLLGTIHKIEGIVNKNNKIYLYTDLQDASSDIKDWEYVSITDKLLKKLSFNNGVIMLNDSFDYISIKLNTEYFDNVVIGNKRHGVGLQYKIEYAHQLQNLFFAVKNTELEIEQ